MYLSFGYLVIVIRKTSNCLPIGQLQPSNPLGMWSPKMAMQKLYTSNKYVGNSLQVWKTKIKVYRTHHKAKHLIPISIAFSSSSSSPNHFRTLLQKHLTHAMSNIATCSLTPLPSPPQIDFYRHLVSWPPALTHVARTSVFKIVNSTNCKNKTGSLWKGYTNWKKHCLFFGDKSVPGTSTLSRFSTVSLLCF